MNEHFVITLLLLLFMGLSTFGQETFIEPNSITVTCNKTTHVVFPYAIKSIDRGSQDVLAQKAPGTDNVLQLKAARADFAETNVTVITANNKLYPLKVNYSLLPEHLTISFVSDLSISDTNNSFYCPVNPIANHKNADVELLQTTINQVAAEKKRMYGLRVHNGLVQLMLKGLYIKNDVFYFQFLINNLSTISFDIQNISFIIKESRKAKRTAIQEHVLQPLLTNGMDSSIQSHSRRVWVVALPKFTLEDGKYLSIQVVEENGGRNLALKLFNQQLLTAKPL